MLLRFFSICILLFSFQQMQADIILDDLKFTEGDWTIVGVPLHNYKMLPIQEDLGTFLVKDVEFMKKIQKEWDLDFTADDDCDYHYALKFYKNRQLVRTLKLNLHCGYLTDDGISYTFPPQLFEQIRSKSRPVDWSRINFHDGQTLKDAIQKLDAQKDVLWYEDVKHYLYKGFFLYNVPNLPWDTNLDSLDNATRKNIEKEAGKSNFYLSQFLYQVQGDYINVSYKVNCDNPFTSKKLANQITNWRPHFATGDSVHVVAIGVNEKKYKQIMFGK